MTVCVDSSSGPPLDLRATTVEEATTVGATTVEEAAASWKGAQGIHPASRPCLTVTFFRVEGNGLAKTPGQQGQLGITGLAKPYGTPGSTHW